MSDIVTALTGIFDQLNPFNIGNLVVFFAWIVVFAFTTVAVWRADNRWVRLFCYLINQIFSVGIVLSWTLTTLLAYTYWQYSLGVFVATALVALWLFRRRPRAEI